MKPWRPGAGLGVLGALLLVWLLGAAGAWAQEPPPGSAAEAAKKAAEAKAGGEGAKEAPAAPAEEEWPSAEAEGYYLRPKWLVVLCILSILWIAMMEWVSEDAQRVRVKHERWNIVSLSLGLGGWVLTLMASPVFLVLAVLASGVLTAVYILRRNQIVSPEQRILTGAHLAYVMGRVLSRFGVKVSQQVLVGKRGQEPAIKLLRKDGKSLDALSTESREGMEHSDATVAVKEAVESAVLSRATDIHVEPKENELQVRFRIDGILHNVPSYPKELGPPIVSAIKVLADMDIAERRKPQDGTFMGKLNERTLDFRVATSPSVHGETLVVRILDREAGLLGLDRLGVDAKRLARLKAIVNSPHGMLIVSGPTGSGKTTTLYAALGEIDAYQKNIITIENPIEYRLDNVTQTQVNPKAGVTFAGQLRSMLRQDPDVVMVGEIRDAETARTALQAAMTGHFVFTTVHANDAVSTLFRLMDLGVEPYLISSSLSSVLAQRLVRVLCENCKVPYVPKPSFVKKVGLDPRRVQQFFKANGCEMCQGTGYFGRVGIFELMEMNDVLRDLIRGNPSLQLIKAEARKNGLVTMQEDGLSKVVKGLTSIKELIRVTK